MAFSAVWNSRERAIGLLWNKVNKKKSKQKNNYPKIRIIQLATPTLQRKGTYIALFIPTLAESLLMDGYQYRPQSNIFSSKQGHNAGNSGTW